MSGRVVIGLPIWPVDKEWPTVPDLRGRDREPSPIRLVGSVWTCGDDWCGCSQARVNLHHWACRCRDDGWHRLGELLWEGEFVTDHGLEAYRELGELRGVMAVQWPEAASVTTWLGMV